MKILKSANEATNRRVTAVATRGAVSVDELFDLRKRITVINYKPEIN